MFDIVSSYDNIQTNFILSVNNLIYTKTSSYYKITLIKKEDYCTFHKGLLYLALIKIDCYVT